MRRWLVRALAASTLLLGVTPGSLAKAADTDAAAAEQTEAKRSVSQSTYERLTQAKKHMEQGQYGEAARLLQELLPQVKDNDYETALTQQSLAYVYLDQKRYREAIRAMEAALARQGLPREVTHALRYNLAQVYIQTVEYRRGLAVLTQWLSDEKNPSADVYFLAAVAHHHLKQDEAAIGHIQKAIAKTPKPREDWHLFLLSLYFEHQRYQEAVPILTQLVTQYPSKPSYWRYLTDVYLNLKREPEALATLKCAYDTGVLEEADRVRLAQLYLHQNLPYSAARLLEREMARGRISRTASHLKLLGNSWAMARDHKRAIGSLQQAAGLVRHGNLYLRVAQLQMNLEHWEEASKSLDQALEKGGLKAPEEAQFLLGVACYHQDDKQRAVTALTQARKSPRYRTQAQRWLEQIQRESSVASARQ